MARRVKEPRRGPFGDFRITWCFPYSDAPFFEDRFNAPIRLGPELDSRERSTFGRSGCSKRVHTIPNRKCTDVCGNGHPDFSKKRPLAQLGLVPANRGVKSGGPYYFVRHPMYAGYTLIHIGFLLGFPSLQNFLLYLTTFLIELARLMREELVLNNDPVYRDYAVRVRYRLLPGIF